MLFPAAKLLDLIIGVDAHGILAPAPPAPAPAPVPMIPHFFVGSTFLWHSPKFPACDVFINGLPALTVGAKSYCVHFPTPPGVWWPKPVTCFPKWFLTHYTTVALSTAFSTLTAATAAMIGISAPYKAQRGKGVEASEEGSNFLTELKNASPQMEWQTILRTLMPPAVLPISEGDISLASPTVTVNGAPMAFVGPMTAGSCSDLPMVPNANTIGFTNVFVGVTLKELLIQLAWNAVDGVTSMLAGRLADRFTTRVTGEPIDICSGSVVEDPIDFEIPGPIPLRWVRHYSSVLVQDGSIGWCWSHEYHRYLKFDSEEILFHDEEGRETRFPRLTDDKPTFKNKQASMTLRRINNDCYELQRRDEPLMIFTFGDGLVPHAMMTELRTPAGANMKFIYDKKHRLVSIVDSGARTFSLDYTNDTSTRIAALRCTRDSYQNETDIFMLGFSYDDSGNLVEVTNAAGNSERYAYGDEHRMTSRTNRLGYSFHYEYNDAGLCVKSYGDDDLYHVKLEHMLAVDMVKVTEPLGGVYLYRFDKNSRVTQLVDACGNGRLFGYDKDGNKNLFVNQNSDVTLYEYDEAHHKVLETDPLGRECSWKYDDKGREIEKVDASGNSSKRTYDNKGNLVEETAPDGAVTKHEYDDCGRKTATIFPDKSLIRFQYGPHSLPIALLDKNWNILERYEYDALGNRTAIISGGQKTTLHYDKLNHLCKVEYPDGTSQQRTFDVEGNVLSYTNRVGATSRFLYGSWNKLMEEIDPLGNTTKYTYNKWDKVNSITDPNGNKFTFTHDLCNRGTGIYENGRVMKTFELDPAGNITSCIGPDEKPALKFIRGKGGLVEKEVQGDGKEIAYSYNETGKIIKAESNDFVQERKYGTNGRVALERCNGDEVTFSYDKNGVQVSTIFPGDRKVTRKYDTESKILTVTDPLGNEHYLEYQGNKLVNRTTSWGLEEQCVTDEYGRITLQKIQNAKKESGEFRERRYSYSTEDDLTNLKDSLTGDRWYGYDRALRLTHVQGMKPEDSLYYEYDAAGNLLRLPDGRRTSIDKGNRLVSAGETRYHYDLYGQLAEKIDNQEVTHFRYDSAGLLKTVIHPDGSETQYNYDEYRRRISKEHGGITTRFLWESDRLIGESVGDTWCRYYIYGQKEDLTPCAFVDYSFVNDLWEGESYSVHVDHIGTPFAVSDKNGEFVWSVELMPYGAVRTVHKNEIRFNFRLPGQYFDEETGLHYNRHRYYDPELGRYITLDPIGFSGGINLYTYTRNPLKEWDFFGLSEHGPKMIEEGEREGGSKKNNSSEDATNEVLTTLNLDEIPRRPVIEDVHTPFRNDTSGEDIKNIADITGFSENDVALAKEHFMMNEHILVDNDTNELYRGRFDPFEDDAILWDKVTKNQELSADEKKYLTKLIDHELFEAQIIKDPSLEVDFANGKLEQRLFDELKKIGVSDKTIDNLKEIEPRPIVPYRYSHLLTHFTGHPNP